MKKLIELSEHINESFYEFKFKNCTLLCGTS